MKQSKCDKCGEKVETPIIVSWEGLEWVLEFCGDCYWEQVEKGIELKKRKYGI